jgi:hypothetical protein
MFIISVQGEHSDSSLQKPKTIDVLLTPSHVFRSTERLEYLIYCYSLLRRVGPNTSISVRMAIFFINDSIFPTLSKQS